METLRLDEAAFAAHDDLKARGHPAPDALFLLGTGVGTLPGSLRSAKRVVLAEVDGVPRAWREAELHSGQIGATSVWIMTDAPGGLEFGEGGEAGSPGWERAYPVWMAAAGGARVCVHTSSGSALSAEAGAGPAPAVGSLGVLSDHINLSGRTPLIGLGETRLGPLFPDQSTTHHAGLRHLAIERAAALGIGIEETVAACTIGPALTTPAELSWLATTGAGVCVQGLAEPLIACAHAGLAALAFVAVIDSGDESLRMSDLVERSERLAPALEDVLRALAPDLGVVARELAEEV